MNKKCPKCGSKNITTKQIDYIVIGECEKCGLEWFEDLEEDIL